MIENFLIVAQQVAVLFVLMGFGAVMRKAGFFKENAIDGIVNVLILVVTPCLIVDVFQRPFDPSMLKGLGLAFLIAVLAHVVLILLAKAAVHHRNEDIRRPLRLAAVFSNAGFMGIPLEQAVLGDVGVFYGIVYVVVFNLFMWSWGLKTMSGGVNRLKMWVNPGTVGLVLVLNFIMMLVVTHKAWGWLMLPVFFVVRVLATIGAALSGFFIMAGMAFRAAAKESFAKAWVQDERSRNYCEGKKNARMSEGFSSAGTGLWGFFVSHTLPYCEVECE